jgi:hypothetical protein
MADGEWADLQAFAEKAISGITTAMKSARVALERNAALERRVAALEAAAQPVAARKRSRAAKES